MDILTNDTHYFPESFFPGRKAILDVSGTSFGGGTVTPGFKAADGSFSPFLQQDGTPITITSRGGFEVRVPRSGILGITLTLATDPAIVLDVIAAVDMTPGS
jgi:hypothetical protein